ncbi:hypothetical protein GOHSU_12_01020 [Gordonia hirsuta DSM 44140 = NBRC 16056]|uniref:Uncharacterized protein n=1 Tax=Gordonia hirsuta DSM 44140 = NBRC 16056 TaxID=1121927 RepID=L7L9I7_9ACTN|nr:hypothetical protein GOHSU_12_01020 [Gordonia hirsuta DSM 44140 = NBRC 16056]
MNALEATVFTDRPADDRITTAAITTVASTMAARAIAGAVPPPDPLRSGPWRAGARASPTGLSSCVLASIPQHFDSAAL